MSIQALNWVFKQDELHNSGAKFVLTVLANFADEDGYCYPSQAVLARITALDDRSIRRHLERLCRGGFIEKSTRRHRNRQGTNIYRLQLGTVIMQHQPDKMTASNEFQPDKMTASNEFQPDKMTASNEFQPDKMTASNEFQPDKMTVSGGQFRQFQADNFDSAYKEEPSEEPSEETQDARVCEPAAAGEEKRRFVTRHPLRGLGGTAPLSDGALPIAFGPYRDALEDWYCSVLGVISLPPNAETATQITWLFDNKFSLADIQGFYRFAKTDPEETKWRRGTITLGAIVKGIAGWKSRKAEAVQPLVDFSHCGECDANGMKQIFIDGELRMTKCRHGPVKTAA